MHQREKGKEKRGKGKKREGKKEKKTKQKKERKKLEKDRPVGAVGRRQYPLLVDDCPPAEPAAVKVEAHHPGVLVGDRVDAAHDPALLLGLAAAVWRDFPHVLFFPPRRYDVV